MGQLAAMLICVLASGASGGEVARSAPIVATVGGSVLQFQGSFELGERDGEFPRVRGHLRAIEASSIRESDTGHGDPSLAIAFDAAAGIPDAISTGCPDDFSGSCRSVFTNLAAGARPAKVMFSTSNAEQLSPQIGADPLELIPRVLSGPLGGVDRSTPAVVGASAAIGTARPTMTYFGATDGMLHAVCADAVAPCPGAGVELWAFLPRTQLPLLARNEQRVDGAPRVDDVFGDFGTFEGTGRRVSQALDGKNEFRTIVVFQTGSTSATYALDVTDPADPAIAWERELPGIGLGVAMGPTRVGGASKYIAFVQTNVLEGPHSPGFAVTAVDAVTGDAAWTFTRQYTDDRGTGAAMPPAGAIPGGVAAVSTAGRFSLDKVVVPSLTGELFVLAASTGNNAGNRTPAQPLFRFAGDGKPLGAPPAIYADGQGRFHALFGSGGYATAGEAPVATGDQLLVSVPLLRQPVATAIDESDELVDFSRNLSSDSGAASKAFAQPTIAGSEAFVATDTENINAPGYGTDAHSGALVRYDLATGQVKGPSLAIAGGASSVDASKQHHKAYIGTKGSLRAVTLVEPAFDPNGSSVELSGFSRTFRRLWLRVQ